MALKRKRFGLNRIIAPDMPLAEFARFIAALGLTGLELQNGPPGGTGPGGLIDGLNPAEARRIIHDAGLRVLAIDALRTFNLPERRRDCFEELKALLSLAAALDCPAVALSPAAEAEDARDPKQRYAHTVEALLEYGHLFAEYGIAGYVEPLAFGKGSPRLIPDAVSAIKASGYGCYRLVFDPCRPAALDDKTIFGKDGLESACAIPHIGILRVSGAAAVPHQRRPLAPPEYCVKNSAVLGLLDRAGYLGAFSFKPRAGTAWRLQRDTLQAAVEASLTAIGVLS
ncbi:MAG: TIM barrel protein [Treponema sp.]|jgi:2-keto-myo-inositol isomerase|nr:TIM barrel protein [Treponema sp.]